MVELTKCIFYHNNKTGGNWVRDALRNSCKVIKELHIHCNVNAYPKGDKKAFAFVRYPVWVYESTYHHFNRPEYKFNYTFLKQWIFPKYCSLPFDKYVETMVDKHPGWLSEYCTAFFNNLDYLGRQEDLRESLLDILDDIGEPYKREIIKTTPISNLGQYKVLMTSRLRKLIEKSEKSMIDRYYGETICQK